MKNFIPVDHYKKVESVTFGNLTDYSTENHTYYMGFDDPKDIILESINSDNVTFYDRVTTLCEINGSILPMMKMIGSYKGSIFDNCPNVDEFGFVMIETKF